MQNPLVSVIIPLYNAEKYIGDTIESVINQTWKNIEIIVVDDSSTDKSFYIANQYQNANVKVLQQENSGASQARNFGYKNSKGEFIQFLDADDILDKYKIENQVKLLLENPGKVAFGNDIHFFNGTNPFTDGIVEKRGKLLLKYLDNPTLFLLNLFGYNGNGSMIQTNSWLTPRYIIEKAGLWNTDIPRNPDDDGEFFCRVVLSSSGLIFVKSSNNYYRKFRNSNNLSNSFKWTSANALFQSLCLKYEYLKPTAPEKDLNIVFARQYMEFAVSVFPRYIDLYKKASGSSKQLGTYKGNFYQHTTFYKIITFIFGWKVSAVLAHIKNQLI